MKTIKEVKTCTKDVALDMKGAAINKWEAAKKINKLFQFDWSNTKYNSFGDYVKKEMKYPASSMYAYNAGWENKNRLGYTDVELRVLCGHFSFNKLRHMFARIPKKMTVSELIKEFQTTQVSSIPKPSSVTTYVFRLDSQHAHILDKLLRPHGMQITNMRRNNLNKAMENYLKTV